MRASLFATSYEFRNLIVSTDYLYDNDCAKRVRYMLTMYLIKALQEETALT